MSGYPFTNPVAPESNPTIEPQNYQPSRFQITAITLGSSTTLTTSVVHNFVVGQLVRILIPPTYGTRQLSGQQGYVISIPSTTSVEVNIDSSLNYDAFVSSPTYGPTKPSIMAIGDTNSGQLNAGGPSAITTYIPGSFINISPQ